MEQQFHIMQGTILSLNCVCNMEPELSAYSLMLFSKLRMQYGTTSGKQQIPMSVSKLRMQYGTSVVTTSKIT